MHGGKRSGAGRPKGSRNKLQEALVIAAAAEGEMPLTMMLRIMRDEAMPAALRVAMCEMAAPYCHAKLASTELKGPNNSALIPSIVFHTQYLNADGDVLRDETGHYGAGANAKLIEHDG
jgi:hypothetical protein